MKVMTMILKNIKLGYALGAVVVALAIPAPAWCVPVGLAVIFLTGIWQSYSKKDARV